MVNFKFSTTKSPSSSELEKAKDDRFSKDVHQKLKRARVAIAGAGGLGSNIAVILARSGVGHLHIVDFDIVDITNLNRQVYTITHIGSRKVDAIKEILMEINPYMKVTTDCVRVVADNCDEIFGGYDIVCEAFDGAESKAMLIDSLLSVENGPIVISGSGMAGYGSANEIKSRRIMDRLFICGDEHTDVGDGIGLMAPRVAVCAGHQANLVMGQVLGVDNI
ncbi:sulfur carrier protein ThiS adenylyltransferase ThiF [Mogibacterium pumilum]|uniref:Thiamine biosynthesis protein ThiF n=1 Tax=Mogibacterium pumilum TaxID=86332 RepID=A0A223AT53_9FIRM|nr:sulfur carrier protein ThiS adenylyltransferase ThiF [Mogibacterium pumilum]ASS38138.1 thiamine biosynthesis protein ThiF [Mogibacterium pumilum]